MAITELEKDSIKISVPTFGWAFNPIIADCVNPNNVKINAVLSDLSVQISRIGYNGKTQFDLSGLSRMLFNRDEFYKVEKVDNTLYKNLSVSFSYTVGSSTTQIGSANIGIIWGGLQIGETFSQNRTYRYFKGYPFTIPLYLEEKAVLKINDTESETLNPGKYNLDITADSIVSLFNEYYRKIFTTIFDKTFQPQRILIGNGIEINIEVCDCNFGDTYLRWINTRGEWNYYLFKKTSEILESEASDIVFENYYDTVNYVSGHHAGTGQYIAKNGISTLNVAAVHLDQYMYDFVRGISLSTIVDLYDKGNWKRVKIGDSDLTKSNRVLQNLEIEVILPNIITQSL